MSEGPAQSVDGSPPDAPAVASPAMRNRAVRLGAALLVGFLLVLLIGSLRSAPPETGRLDRSVELAELVRIEQARVHDLAERVEELSGEVAAYERASTGGEVELARLQEAVDELAKPAGMTPVRGPGLTATLRDSRVVPPRDADANNYIIHEEDLQAVINALWAGGAEAMSVNGNRILATTAIRCVGNVLLLHGNTYSPPYEITAIGDAAELQDALDRDPAVERFRQAVHEFQLGLDIEPDDDWLVPGFEGVSAMQVARPLESGA